MNKKIAVVDDDEGILEAFDVLLSEKGYQVQSSSNAKILFDFTKDTLPDLIVLDVLLSGVDGRDICRKLKSQEETKNIPIIMISAHPGAGKTMKEVGADDFIPKPFEIDELFNKIEKYTS